MHFGGPELREEVGDEPETEPAEILCDAGRALEEAGAMDTASASPSARPPQEPASSLAAEVKDLDGVRRALRQNNGGAALRALEAYYRSHPRPKLGDEALLLRIHALVMVGHLQQGRALADGFIRRNPDSPLVPRIRSLVGLERK